MEGIREKREGDVREKGGRQKSWRRRRKRGGLHKERESDGFLSCSRDRVMVLHKCVDI